MSESSEVEGHDGHQAVPLPALVEGVLFVTDAPVAVTDLARALEVTRPQVEAALADLAGSYADRGLRLQRTNGHVQLVSAPEAAWAIQRFFGLESVNRLSRAALETLSIVAYRQPVTRPEIDALRGVDSEAVLRTLLSRGLIEALGQRDTVGHPHEYATTFAFLEYFGLADLGDLPPPTDLVPAEEEAVPAAEAGGPSPNGFAAVVADEVRPNGSAAVVAKQVRPNGSAGAVGDAPPRGDD